MENQPLDVHLTNKAAYVAPRLKFLGRCRCLDYFVMKVSHPIIHPPSTSTIEWTSPRLPLNLEGDDHSVFVPQFHPLDLVILILIQFYQRQDVLVIAHGLFAL